MHPNQFKLYAANITETGGSLIAPANLSLKIQAMVDEHMQQLLLVTPSSLTPPSATSSAMTSSGPSSKTNFPWIFYSGASYHMTCDSSLFELIVTLPLLRCLYKLLMVLLSR